jgi:hypothetical protein
LPPVMAATLPCRRLDISPPGYVRDMGKGLLIENKSPRNNFFGGPETFDDRHRPNDQLFFNKKYLQVPVAQATVTSELR